MTSASRFAAIVRASTRQLGSAHHLHGAPPAGPAALHLEDPRLLDFTPLVWLDCQPGSRSDPAASNLCQPEQTLEA